MREEGYPAVSQRLGHHVNDTGQLLAAPHPDFTEWGCMATTLLRVKQHCQFTFPHPQEFQSFEQMK
jgi:hypothetical protein